MFSTDSYKARMVKALEHLEQEFASLQMGRATTGLVDNIPVDAGYGVLPISQVANVAVMDTTTIKIEPRDKTLVAKLEKAIYDANTGLVPQGMGEHILVKIPPLTQERRQEVSKQVAALGEDIKIRLRQIRHDAREDIEKLHDAKEISEDHQKGYQKDIDELTKEMTSKIESHVKNKQHDVLSN